MSEMNRPEKVNMFIGDLEGNDYLYPIIEKLIKNHYAQAEEKSYVPTIKVGKLLPLLKEKLEEIEVTFHDGLLEKEQDVDQELVDQKKEQLLEKEEDAKEEEVTQKETEKEQEEEVNEAGEESQEKVGTKEEDGHTDSTVNSEPENAQVANPKALIVLQKVEDIFNNTVSEKTFPNFVQYIASQKNFLSEKGGIRYCNMVDNLDLSNPGEAMKVFYDRLQQCIRFAKTNSWSAATQEPKQETKQETKKEKPQLKPRPSNIDLTRVRGVKKKLDQVPTDVACKTIEYFHKAQMEKDKELFSND